MTTPPEPSGRHRVAPLPSARRAAALLPLLLVAATPAARLGPAAHAGAATRQADAANGTMLQLLQQSPVVGSDGRFRVQVTVSGPVTNGTALAVTVHGRVRSGAALRSAERAEGLGTVLGFRRYLLPSAPTGAVTVDVQASRQGDGTDGCDASANTTGTNTTGTNTTGTNTTGTNTTGPTATPVCVDLRDDGVYPVHVELRGADGDPITDLVTFAIRSTVAPARRLRVALVMPLHLPPAIGPDGAAVETDPVGLRDLVARIEALAQHPLVPITLLPTPETLDRLRRSDPGGVLDTLRTAISGREIVRQPYVRLPVGVLDDPARSTEVTQEFAAGARVVRDALGAAAELTTMVVRDGEPLPGSDALSRLGISRLLAPAARFSGNPIEGSPFLYDPAATEGAGGRDAPALTAVTYEPAQLAELHSDDTVLGLHHLLADLSLRAQEAGRDERDAGVVLVADAALPRDVLDELISDLGTNTLFSAVNLAEAFALPPATASDGSAEVRSAAEPTGIVSGELLPLAADAARVRERLVGYASLFDAPTPTGDELGRRLLTSLSADLTAADRQSFVERVGSSLDTELGRVTIPPRRRFTVTSASSRLVITVQSTTDRPVRVRVTVRGDRLAFPPNTSRECLDQRSGSRQRSCDLVLAGRSTQLSVPVATRSSGTSVLNVELTSPNGTVLATARYTIRSYAVSGIGVVLTAAAFALFVLWWVRHNRRRDAPVRHVARTALAARRPVPPVSDGPPGDEHPDDLRDNSRDDSRDNSRDPLDDPRDDPGHGTSDPHDDDTAHDDTAHDDTAHDDTAHDDRPPSRALAFGDEAHDPAAPMSGPHR